MRAIVALVGLVLVALAGTARAQDPASLCTNAGTAFTRKELESCLERWKGSIIKLPEFNDSQKPNLTNLSPKDITDLIRAIQELNKIKTAAVVINEPDTKTQARSAGFLESAAIARRDDTMRVFGDLNCHNDSTYCADRHGEPYAPHEKEPKLLAGDTLIVIVISDDPNDIGTIVLRAENVRHVLLDFPPKEVKEMRKSLREVNRSYDQAPQNAPGEVARLTVTTKTDVARVIIKMTRDKEVPDKKILDVPVTGRQHLIEFGLMLPFAYQREVTPQGAVKYGMEPDLAFTITVFPGARSSSEPWQSRVASWFGLMAGADLTNQVSDKRYYLGLDFSPVSGLALNAGLAILPWEYVPNPEQVPDVLTGDIEPDQRYRASFFFGARMTPEVFDTVKAAYQSLQGQ